MAEQRMISARDKGNLSQASICVGFSPRQIAPLGTISSDLDCCLGHKSGPKENSSLLWNKVERHSASAA